MLQQVLGSAWKPNLLEINRKRKQRPQRSAIVESLDRECESIFPRRYFIENGFCLVRIASTKLTDGLAFSAIYPSVPIDWSR